MDLDLSLVEDFLALVRDSHYGRAAERRHMSASALTKRIQRLERQVGCCLLERGPSGVRNLTGAGRRFAAEAVPLLAQAYAARASAQADEMRPLLRFGIPAGTGAVLGAIGPSHLTAPVRGAFPGIRLVCVEVPFPSLTTCLPDQQVDVLWTNAAVPHPAVESFPMAVTSVRIGLVGDRHPFADAGEVAVEDFGDTTVLYNPAVPQGNMAPLWLGDLRDRSDAQLTAVDSQDQASFLRHLLSSDAAMVTFPVIATPLDPRLRAVALRGAPPLPFYAACRRTDRRGPVRALVGALLGLTPTLLGFDSSTV